MAAEPTYSTISLSRTGAKRKHIPAADNEDRVLVREFTPADTRREQSAVLIAVADGVSRCPDGGGIAQWLIHERMEVDSPFEASEESLVTQYRKYLHRIHQQFINEFRGNPEMLESGCTLCAVLLSGDRGAVFWAGDSPVHHFRVNDRQLLHGRTLTIADKDPFTGALTDCFSGLTPFAVKQSGLTVKEGDIIAAVSDGVAYDVDSLATMLAQDGFTQEWADQLVEDSYNRPYSDDITIAALRVDSLE